MAYAYAVVTSLMATIDHHFLQPNNPSLLLQNKEEIHSMYEKLRFVQAFLEGTEKKSGDLEAWKDVEAKIRDFSVEAEAKIELRLRKFYMADEGRRKRNKEKAHRRLHLTLRQVIDDTEELMRMIVNRAHESGNNSRRGNSISGDGALSSDRVNSCVVVGCQGTIVGCDEDLTMLLDRLTRESKQREVVSIVGMGGIGKTTLAYRIYKHSLVSSHFDIQAWITVSQECNFREMLLDVLHCVTKMTQEMYKQVEDELATRLRKILMGRRYLIVMDDIWSIDLWDDIQRCFPDNGNGSRILLTTRLKEVTDYTSPGNNCYNMRFLDSNESWNLFYKKVLEGNEFPLEFHEIGRDIVEKCRGLPLAINVIAGLLSKTNKKKGEWENIAKNVSKFVSSDPNQQCSRILALSYNHLPLHLKICFLHLGIFPRDTEIPVKKLEKLWAAEGILGGESSKRVEQVANAKLQDLVDRNLVIISEHSFDGKIKTCRMHDLLQELCMREAQKEILLNFSNEDDDDEESQSIYLLPKTLRWLSVGSGRYDDFHLYHTFGKFRSILFFMNLERFRDLERKLVFLRSKLLRVLDIASVQIPHPGVGILNLIVQAGLVHLRYLALRFSSNFEENLPSSQLWSLQTYIAVYGRIDTRKLPTRIMKLPLLRHLCFDKIYISDPSLVFPESLETMLWLDHRSHTRELFQRLSNLKELGIKGDGSKKSLGELDWTYNLVYLCQVETLRIAVPNLTCLSWSCFPPNLKKLTFNSTKMQWKDMNVLGMLPNLEVLKLKNRAFIGPQWEWEPEEGGFCGLKYLLIKDTDLMHWEVNGDPFPILQRLCLRCCFELKELPIGFADITTLQLIELEDCNPSLLTSAKHIQEEQQNYGNDAILVRYKLTALEIGTVDEYIAMFRARIEQTPGLAPHIQLGLFLNGLQPAIRVRLRPNDETDLRTAMRMARAVEREIDFVSTG